MTVKDIHYALEYGHELLCFWSQAGSTPAHWTLEPSGTKVPSRIATEARDGASIVGVPKRGPAGAYGWRQAA